MVKGPWGTPPHEVATPPFQVGVASLITHPRTPPKPPMPFVHT